MDEIEPKYSLFEIMSYILICNRHPVDFKRYADIPLSIIKYYGIEILYASKRDIYTKIGYRNQFTTTKLNPNAYYNGMIGLDEKNVHRLDTLELPDYEFAKGMETIVHDWFTRVPKDHKSLLKSSIKFVGDEKTYYRRWAYP
jgi:hypothetical protein